MPRYKYLLRSLLNKILYRANAPYSAQLIKIKPIEVTHAISMEALIERRHSGRVMGGDWDQAPVPLENLPKHRICLLHFQDGVPWEEAGAFTLMQELLERHGAVDGCSSMEDVKLRYENLDLLYEQFKSGDPFKTRKQLAGKRQLGEKGGVYIHIDRHGKPLFGRGGQHRLSIAQIVGLEEIPAQLGVVHKAALSIWKEKYSFTQ